MFIARDERPRDLPLDRPPDLLDGIEIRRVWRKMYETDVVACGILPDHDGMMRAEVVEDDDKPFVGIRSPVLSQHLPNVFLFGALPERDDGRAVDGENGKRIGPDLFGILHERQVVE